jgi:hypothetical protein
MTGRAKVAPALNMRGKRFATFLREQNRLNPLQRSFERFNEEELRCEPASL